MDNTRFRLDGFAPVCFFVAKPEAAVVFVLEDSAFIITRCPMEVRHKYQG
jgi:hypothetical protein